MKQVVCANSQSFQTSNAGWESGIIGSHEIKHISQNKKKLAAAGQDLIQTVSQQTKLKAKRGCLLQRGVGEDVFQQQWIKQPKHTLSSLAAGISDWAQKVPTHRSISGKTLLQ